MRGWRGWLAVAGVVVFLGLLAFGLTRDAQTLPSALLGSEAPVFEGETLEGERVSLEEYRGGPLVLNFWASWCIPCRQEHEVLKRAERVYGAEGVGILGVVYQDRRDNALRFTDRLGGDWTSVMDPGSRIAIDYGVYGVPETFFLTADGRVAHKHVGPVTWEVLEAVVDSLLENPSEVTARRSGGDDGEASPTSDPDVFDE